MTSADFIAADFDTDGFWDDGTPDRLTIQQEGWYIIHAYCQIHVGGTDNDGEISYFLNGSVSGSFAAWASSSGGDSFLDGFSTQHFDLDDTLDWFVYQNGGSTQATPGVAVVLLRLPGL